MSSVQADEDARAKIPPRDGIAALLLADEDRLVEELIDQARFSEPERRQIERVARDLVQAARAGRQTYGGVDSFLHEYGLLTEEGVLLLCLAEALLRIPDKATADRLIAGTISAGDWAKHLGHSPSLFVNASTWGLMLTGRVLNWGTSNGNEISKRLQRLVSRTGEGVIRESLRHAMRILGGQFVLGETIEEAIRNGKDAAGRGYRFSYDMLGEAARSEDDAQRYLQRYAHAIEAIAADQGEPAKRDGETLHQRSGLSIKLSALHPRYEPSQAARMQAELLPRLKRLAVAMREAYLPLTIDAEEADRLDLSLSLLQPLFEDPDLAGWDGLGLAIQGYSKRVLPLIAWLAAVARATGRRIPMRLVKGAYWDSEIKWAQVAGLSSYPVFTRKVNTDVSYLAATRALMERPDCFFPQFATHNAHTIAAVHRLGEGADYEFQRLFGMGEPVHEAVISPDKLGRPCRIYAPVGGHSDLLAYLVRRLLENGANTSFVNRLADDEAPIAAIIADPVENAEANEPKANPRIPLPGEIFAPRKNAEGLPLWDNTTREPLIDDMRDVLQEGGFVAGPIVSGKLIARGEPYAITSPHDRQIEIGQCRNSDSDAVEAALDAAQAAAPDWDRRGGEERAAILEKAADLMEADRPAMMALLVREAGKTLENAQSDLREAVDHLRYAASQARENFGTPKRLPGPTGEENLLSLHRRGVFACISPWNFPLAIFSAQIGAALAAGNAVVAKPAEQTPLIAARAVRLIHEAGVPVDILHLLPGPGEVVGQALVKDARVNGVAFTGGTDTGIAINRDIAAREGPVVPLIAEMGGLNAMIVDSSALPEQVVDDVITSAFDSAGQRCSALRALFLQEEVADRILEMLTGAVRELSIGDPLDYSTDVGPVIDPQAKLALQAHKVRMRAEATEVLDLPLPDDLKSGTYVSPAIYEIGSLSELKAEVFGPILHVVRYPSDGLAAVCDQINASGFGLTLGLHSRVEQAAEYVAAHARVGNFYVNRNQIGAVVGAQPFGGEGLSGTGPKAGGPNYLERFATERVVTVNTTASGGNAKLLAATDEE
ncbi:bifunctional proline dehydrogenase/L-glutamate gamma-semialdehyde dehydrogenase PutA [Methyloligella solikamskensis]|uniref:Bifunctional protein PutA n=1 Tax=Methyloligella solikamskensis TaxID=1177756 RepID=A0ABW3J9Y4_9HYPH